MQANSLHTLTAVISSYDCFTNTRINFLLYFNIHHFLLLSCILTTFSINECWIGLAVFIQVHWMWPLQHFELAHMTYIGLMSPKYSSKKKKKN